MRERFQEWLLRDVTPLTPEQVIEYRPERVPAREIDDLVVIDRLLQVRRFLVALASSVALIGAAATAAYLELVQAPFVMMAMFAFLPLYVFGVNSQVRIRQFNDRARLYVIPEPVASELAQIAADPETARIALDRQAAEGRPVTIGLVAAILMCRPTYHAV